MMYFACAIAWVCLYIYIFLESVFSGPQVRGVGHTQSYAFFVRITN